MKTSKGTRPTPDHGDELRRAKRLEPIHKSGKERHSLYHGIDDDDDEADYRPHRESAFDYFDDGEEDER